MQRRAEVRAVKREDSGLRQLDVHGLGLTRIHHQVDIVFDQSEPVNHVAGLLDVRDMNRKIIPDLRVDPVRHEPTADRSHPGFDGGAVTRRACLRFVPDCVRVFVLRFRISLDWLDLADL